MRKFLDRHMKVDVILK